MSYGHSATTSFRGLEFPPYFKTVPSPNTEMWDDTPYQTRAVNQSDKKRLGKFITLDRPKIDSSEYLKHWYEHNERGNSRVVKTYTDNGSMGFDVTTCESFMFQTKYPRTIYYSADDSMKRRQVNNIGYVKNRFYPILK